METVIFILKNFVLVLLEVMQLAMLGRAIMSWFDHGEGTVSTFLTFVTEPFILPIRRLCERMHWFENSMIDIPFFITMIIFMVLQTFLSVF
ncbi:MAG: YggT family protein [Clostridia bacterium]|nr:YggT family protein [Clostridia bacterium]